MTSKILLKNALICSPDRIIRADLLTDGEFIAKIGKDLSSQDAETVDCHELMILPGLIDEHVHFREPGMESKATIRSESRAAALGGVTSFMDMPNNQPPTTTLEALEHKHELARRDSLVNYAFYLGADAQHLAELERLDPKKVPALKIFMGSSTGSLLLDDEKLLREIFRRSPVLIATHCEDNAIINRNLKLYKERHDGRLGHELHPFIRSRDCCLKSASLAVELALESKARLHLMHLSTKEEVELIRPYQKGDLYTRSITAEACIPHLYFEASAYPKLGGLLKCNPAVKFEQDRSALVQGVEDGLIITVATDHAPHEKELKCGEYLNTASGLPSVQFSLLVLLELWKRGELSLEQLMRAGSSNVAERYGIVGRGRLEEGAYADLALINVKKPFTVTQDKIASPCGISPFLGHTFPCSLIHTLVNGQFVVRDEKLIETACARPLSFKGAL
ncbi:MAG: amidohydrolase family protein [Succinivibrio sp.]|nr:amidohydrolase family protein [Succinivibrio sp.]